MDEVESECSDEVDCLFSTANQWRTIYLGILEAGCSQAVLNNAQQ